MISYHSLVKSTFVSFIPTENFNFLETFKVTEKMKIHKNLMPCYIITNTHLPYVYLKESLSTSCCFSKSVRYTKTSDGINIPYDKWTLTCYYQHLV